MSDQPVAETTTGHTQQSQQTDTHAIGRGSKPQSGQASSRFRPRSYRVRHFVI